MFMLSNRAKLFAEILQILPDTQYLLLSCMQLTEGQPGLHSRACPG